VFLSVCVRARARVRVCLCVSVCLCVNIKELDVLNIDQLCGWVGVGG
jgi:hypothetical protein